MAVTIDEITTKAWSINVGSIGDIVADSEDLKQCIMLIVFTKKGTVPGLLEFGCDWFDYIDQPVTSAAPLMLREIRKAITRWEPRARITGSSSSIDGSTIHIGLQIQATFAREDDPVGTTFISFDLDTFTGTMVML